MCAVANFGPIWCHYYSSAATLLRRLNFAGGYALRQSELIKLECDVHLPGLVGDESCPTNFGMWNYQREAMKHVQLMPLEQSQTEASVSILHPQRT